MSRINWNREEQITFAKKVAKICNKKFNTNFYPKYQGSGPVVILKMTNRNEKLVTATEQFLEEEFGFKIADPGKHGVGGLLYTLLLNISEVTEDTIKKIEEVKLAKIIKTKLIVSVPVVSDPIPVIEPVAEVAKTRRSLDHVSWGRMTVLKFLTPIFRFENSLNGKKDHPEVEKLFWFEKRVNGPEQILHCYDAETASKIYPAILWLTGESSGSTLVRLEGKEIIINFSKTEKASAKDRASFCFGPSYGASLTDVEIRLGRIRLGCIPVVIALEKNSFKVSYKRVNTGKKIHFLIFGMGWNVSALNEDGSFICYLPAESIPAQEISSVEAIPIEVLPENSETITNKEQPVSTPTLVSDKKEAWEQLNNIYSDQKYFFNLSEETQKKVILTLRNNWKETDPEGFIQNLLSFFE